MKERPERPRWRPSPALAFAAAWLVALMWATAASAQGPQVDVDNPPGAPNSRGRLGEALGASGTSEFDGTSVARQESLFGGRPGPSATRLPINQIGAPAPAVTRMPPLTPPRPVEAAPLPQYGDVEIPAAGDEPAPGGLTLDEAIDRLLRANLNLLALRYELTMADADVLTAGLRNNPIFYSDAQLVPYGHYSNRRPGGSTQYDVNVTLPLDVWRKRRARTIVARRAKRVTEAQFQDAVRVQIDNLYTVFVDASAADLTLRFSRAYVDGLRRLLGLNEQLRGAGFILPADVLALKAQLELAELQVRESEEAVAKARRTLALMLNLPLDDPEAARVRALVFDPRPLPTTREALIETALNARPDLLAYRMGVLRAQADVLNARAQRFSDVYLLYQPYTYQDNHWQGLKSASSYSLGVTVALPLFNRNQGNVARAQTNADQSKVEAAALERQIAFEVGEAVREYDLSLVGVQEYRREVLPASREVRDSAFRRWQGGETSALAYLEAQQEYNTVVRQYRDALVRHRRAMLDLNTAVGTRVSP